MVLVAVQLLVMGLYLPARVRLVVDAAPAPDDHLTAGPNSRVIWLAAGRVDGAGGCPAISAGIVSPALPRPRRSSRCRSKLRCDLFWPPGALVRVVAVH